MQLIQMKENFEKIPESVESSILSLKSRNKTNIKNIANGFLVFIIKFKTFINQKLKSKFYNYNSVIKISYLESSKT
jgi:hypothetical protein